MTWVSYDGDYNVRGRFFGSDGVPEGDDFVVSTIAQSFPENGAIAVLTGGRIVAAWASYDVARARIAVHSRPAHQSGRELRGRGFHRQRGHAEGLVRQHAARLGDGAGGRTLRRGLACRGVPLARRGRFADRLPHVVRAKLYDADGRALGNEFTVTAREAGADFPSFAALDDGRFVVVWEAYDQGDGDGSCIRSQTFDPKVFDRNRGTRRLDRRQPRRPHRRRTAATTACAAAQARTASTAATATTSSTPAPTTT